MPPTHWLLRVVTDLPENSYGEPQSGTFLVPSHPGISCFPPVDAEHAGPGAGCSGLFAPIRHPPQVSGAARLLQGKRHLVPSAGCREVWRVSRARIREGVFPEHLPGLKGVSPPPRSRR